MTKLYDGSYQDIANRLRDDDLISLKLVHTAADMIERYGKTLEKVMNVLNNCPRHEVGAGGQTIEAGLLRTKINQVPAMVSEEIFAVLHNIDPPIWNY